MSSTDELPDLYKEPFKRLLRNHGKRSSPEAVEEMKQEVEVFAYRIAQRAASLAEHAERQTIKPEDMQKALKQLEEER